MYVDVDGDGSLDDETPVKGRQSEQYTVYSTRRSLSQGRRRPPSPITVMRILQLQRTKHLPMISSGSYTKGRPYRRQTRPLCLGGLQHQRTFDDKAEILTPTYSSRSERDRKTFHVGNYQEYGDTLYRVKIARDGAFVELTPASDVAWGIVNVPLSITKFTVGGLNGMYEKTPKEGRVRLPEGTYRVNEWQIDRKDKGQNWTLSGSGFPRQTAFNVSSDTPVTMDVGEPVFSQLSVNESQGGFAVNQQLRGKQGEPSAPSQWQPPARPSQHTQQTAEYTAPFRWSMLSAPVRSRGRAKKYRCPNVLTALVEDLSMCVKCGCFQAQIRPLQSSAPGTPQSAEGAHAVSLTAQGLPTAMETVCWNT
jgi:hypothetical protein